MGWMNIKGGVWGDEPQDEVDKHVERKLGKKWFDNKSLTIARKARAHRELMASKGLRDRLDNIYHDNWGRKIRVVELKNLLKVVYM